MDWIAANYVDVIKVIVAVIGVASLVAKLTPSKSDDAVVDWLLNVINKLALNPNKENARH